MISLKIYQTERILQANDILFNELMKHLLTIMINNQRVLTDLSGNRKKLADVCLTFMHHQRVKMKSNYSHGYTVRDSKSDDN